jgi:uncharacterized membrane protein YphA (DoxX/SURF4 family)
MRRWALLALRLFLAAIFLYAAWTKLSQPWALFALSIDSYGLLPEWAVVALARTLPWIEVALGIWLATGVFQRASAVLATGLLGFFLAIMIYSYAQGKQIDCGCFGVGEQLSWKTLARDGALLAAAVTLAVAGKGGKRVSAF